jgi:hypothetical protein
VYQVTTHHSKITQRITRNKATAVPSLKRLSHSKRIVSLLGAQSDLNIDKTATGSVADIKTQNIKHTRKGTCIQTKGRAKNKTQDIKNADINNQNIAIDEIALQLDNNCL